VRLLLRLYDLQAGSILIDGQDISKVTQGSLRENILIRAAGSDPVPSFAQDNIKYGKTDATDEQVIEARQARALSRIHQRPSRRGTIRSLASAA